MANYKLGRFAKLVSRTPATIRRWKAEGTISSKRLPSDHRYNSGKVCRLIFAHKDRLVRFGFDLIRRLCESWGYEVIVVSKMTCLRKQERLEDMLAIVQTFRCRLEGRRKFEKGLREEFS